MQIFYFSLNFCSLLKAAKQLKTHIWKQRYSTNTSAGASAPDLLNLENKTCLEHQSLGILTYRGTFLLLSFIFTATRKEQVKKEWKRVNTHRVLIIFLVVLLSYWIQRRLLSLPGAEQPEVIWWDGIIFWSQECEQWLQCSQLPRDISRANVPKSDMKKEQ